MADIVFSDVKPLSGIEFTWPHGMTRKQFLRVDMPARCRKRQTTFFASLT